MDLFVFWNGLLRSSARPSWLIEAWLPDLFDPPEIELIESGFIDSETWAPEIRSMTLLQIERLGFFLLLSGWSAEDRMSRIFGASEAIRSITGQSRDEWPIGLSNVEKAGMSTLLDDNAQFGFRGFNCALLIRLEQEFDPLGEEFLPRGIPTYLRQPIAPLRREGVSMFGYRWPDLDEAVRFLPSLGNGALVRGFCRLPEASFSVQKAKLLQPDRCCGRVPGINRTLEPLETWTPEDVRQRHRFLLNVLKSAWNLPYTE